MNGTFLDSVGSVLTPLLETNTVNTVLGVCFFMAFILLSALTVMNMLIGVLCEVVSAVAASEKGDNAIRIVKDKLLVMLRELDEDGSGKISQEEIQQVLAYPDALRTLDNLNV